MKSIFGKHNIKFTEHNPLNLKSLIVGASKNKIDDKNKSGIYGLKCGVCNEIYFGQINRSILKRFNEHCYHVKVEPYNINIF